MNTRVRTSLKPMRPPKPLAAHHHNKEKKMEMQEGRSFGIDQAKEATVDRRKASRDRKMALQEDVDNLKKKLRQEENVHRALERAFTRPLGVLPRLPPYLPKHTLELLAEVAVLEEEVVRLEEQVVVIRQEAARRNGETMSDSSTDYSSIVDCTPVILRSPSRKEPYLNASSSRIQPAIARTTSIKKLLDADRFVDIPCRLANAKIDRKTLIEKTSKENRSSKTPLEKQSPDTKQSRSSANHHSVEKTLDKFKRQPECRLTNHERSQQNSSLSSDERSLDFECMANKTSEEVLSCLSAIFMRLNSPKQKTSEFKAKDPHRSSGGMDMNTTSVCTQSLQRSLGHNKHLCLIEADSFHIRKTSSCKILIQRLRITLGKLAFVKIEGLTHHQKLAFWINVYNSCMMNAFLEHGVPESADRVAELMQKATINIGGHLLNAITIEHFILRLPYHLKYTCPKVARSNEMKAYSAFALEWSEPLVTFALSCGSRSSPAVRVYTAAGVESELETAKRDYLQTAVGISETSKLMIPKLLAWYFKDFAKDMESLVDWVCLQLPDDLRMAAIDCLESRRHEPVSNYVQVVPFDFSFQYLLYK